MVGFYPVDPALLMALQAYEMCPGLSVFPFKMTYTEKMILSKVAQLQ